MFQDGPNDDDVQNETIEPSYPTPKLVASTGDTYCCSVSETLRKEKESNSETAYVSEDPNARQDISDGNKNAEDSNYFKGAEWCVRYSSSCWTQDSRQ